MGNTLSQGLYQSFFIPQPTLTEKNLPDQKGRVHIVTGGYAGCGQELSRMLYQHNATVYVAGRSPEKAQKSIEATKQKFPNSQGKIEFLQLDLADISTIKKTAEEFMAKEKRLDVLTNNAGVMVPPKGSKDAHGHEMQMGTNVLGHWALARALLPVLKDTAKSAPQGSVRVTWAASLAAYMSPKGGVAFTKSGEPKCHDTPSIDYAQSKGGNVLLATEFAERHAKDGILSVSWNPGNLKTELGRHTPAWQMAILDKLMLYPAVYGAYTELFSACSEKLTMSQNGAFVAPWGRIEPMRTDLVVAGKAGEQGGTGVAKQLWEWCEKEADKYM